MKEDKYETAEDLIESWDEAYSHKENGRTTAFDAPRLQPLLWVDTSPWDSTPCPPREWAVRDRIPLRQVSLFSGEGAIGKSIVELPVQKIELWSRRRQHGPAIQERAVPARSRNFEYR